MTNIERLPDELWLEIFSYISYLDLFRCFIDLNERVNAIVRSKRIKLKFRNHQSYEKYKFLIKALPEYIISIRIDYYNQDIDLSPLKNLFSIHIGHPTDKQLILIQSNYFQYLNQLNIVVCSTNFQLGDFLFNNQQLNYLTTCWLPTLDLYFQDNQSYKPCLTLRSLRLNYCHINTFFKVLHFLPSLTSFESALVSIGETNCLPSIEHFNLIRLKISLRANVPFSDLKSMILSVPSLEQFYLIKPDMLEDKLDLVLLASLLENQLLNLKKCEIKLNLFSTNLKINLDDLKHISPLFTEINLHQPETHNASLSAWYQNLLSRKTLPK